MITNNQTVLWAEDEAFHIGLVREVVKEKCKGVYLAEANNGREVLRFLDDAVLLNILPHIIVLDINMPDMDGRKALINIITRPELKHIPKVLFSNSKSLLDNLFSARYHVPLVFKSANAEDCKRAINGILESCMSHEKVS
jgi:CheY-like chemotaxis protein